MGNFFSDVGNAALNWNPVTGPFVNPKSPFNITGGKNPLDMNKTPDQQTTTTSNEPWSGVRQPLLNYYAALQNWYNSPKSTVAGISPETQQAWDLTAQRATQGSPLETATKQGLYNTASGNMFNQDFNNQWDYAAGQLGKQFRDITMPSIDARFSAGGRTGSNAQQSMYGKAMEGLGTSLSGLAADIYGQERNRQMQAFGMTPQLSALDYSNLAQLGSVGEGKRAYEQQLLNEPLTKLQVFGGGLQPGLNFGTSTSTQPLYKNPLSSGLGGAMAGYSLGGPVGAAIGGGLGYFSGL